MVQLSRRRVLGSVVGVSAGLVWPSAALAAAPSTPIDGRFVMRADGAVYFVGSGFKRVVRLATDVDDAELDPLPDGEPIVTLALGASGGAPAAPVLAPATVSGSGAAEPRTAIVITMPGETGPVAGLIGQRVLAKGSNDQKVAVTVTDARWFDSYPGSYGIRYATGMFAGLVVEVENQGIASSYCGVYTVQLVDERNRRFDASRVYMPSSVERAWGFLDGTNPRVNPGLMRKSLLIFDVPAEARLRTMIPYKR